jgi:hypothetical protein
MFLLCYTNIQTPADNLWNWCAPWTNIILQETNSIDMPMADFMVVCGDNPTKDLDLFSFFFFQVPNDWDPMIREAYKWVSSFHPFLLTFTQRNRNVEVHHLTGRWCSDVTQALEIITFWSVQADSIICWPSQWRKTELTFMLVSALHEYPVRICWLD